MQVFTTDDAPGDLLERVRDLLEEAFEGEFTAEDWAHTLGGWHIVVTEDAAPLAHTAVVPRTLTIGDRPYRTGYVEGVATAPARQGEGLGGQVMSRATTLVRERFEVGALSTSRHTFYERLGWERWHGPSFVLHGDDPVRTAEEDEGIMVLRFGPSRGIDLTDPIACESRPGDDW